MCLWAHSGPVKSPTCVRVTRTERNLMSVIMCSDTSEWLGSVHISVRALCPSSLMSVFLCVNTVSSSEV